MILKYILKKIPQLSIVHCQLSIRKQYHLSKGCISNCFERRKIMEIYHGRPENWADRLPKEIRVYDLLDRLGIEYVRVDHEVVMTMEACREIDQTLGMEICKNLLLCNRQKTAFYLLLIPGDKVFQTKELSKQIGTSRLSFASGEHMEELLDITPGSLSVLGLANDKDMQVQLLIDEDILKCPTFGCHPCINTSTLRFATADLMEKLIPAMGHEPRFVTLT